MNAIKEKDLRDGFKAEDEVLEKFEYYFKTLLTKTKKYATTDFSNSEFEIELKMRNNNYSLYPSTMIGQNKIDYMKLLLINTNKRCILAFKFTDGLYIIELNAENIKSFQECESGGRKDRGKCEWKNRGYCYIPIKLLTKI
jgi:hypothetical protein